MKEATDDDDTNQAQTHDSPNSANNESKQNKLSIKHLVSFLNWHLHFWLVVNALAQEELDCMYSTVNKDKKAPDESNRKINETESSKYTAAGIYM